VTPHIAAKRKNVVDSPMASTTLRKNCVTSPTAYSLAFACSPAVVKPAPAKISLA
jgi:hypothetical protein